jgi:hypothetical protein
MDTDTKKDWWTNVKNNAWVWVFLVVFGFGLGKLYTLDSIALDCKILGMFRFADVAFHCKAMTP